VAEDDSTGPWNPAMEARAATIVSSLERMRPDAFAHARRVAHLAVRVARHAHLPEALASQIYWGALVHDVGELNIRPDLLQKDSWIDERERMAICEHTIVGARWLAGVPELAPLVPFARWHHERFDGLGYPDGANSGQVPLAVALVGVCDAWDALTEARPYRDPLSIDDAATEMWRYAGQQWSRALVTWTIDCAQDGADVAVAEELDDDEVV
jgi:HD-GYP domain-containing protein (c-di-GMP phosphodiesterase class II)